MALTSCSASIQCVVAPAASKRGASLKVQKPLAARDVAFSGARGVRALAARATTSFAAGRQLQPATAMAKDLWVTAESKQKVAQWVSNLGLGDIIGGDLIRPNIGTFMEALETYGSIGLYTVPEGGYEGRYILGCKRNGYQVLNVNARGLGDLEAYLTKVHGVRPAHLGKQPIARFYEPGLINMIQDVLPANKTKMLLWVQDCKVLSSNEVAYLTILAAENPNIRVVCEVGVDRVVSWKPLKDVYGLVPGKF
eukprot:CAMPEP_0198198130 /NCGR_PEP_ID=MMETSP1445-20131203/1616_1 /TAXON_ID=36898 /ORGANISM="Pyramimonas sp., Strain CCMP2087" /LENGTH=251 /DNA_ID=CAMNT_0043867595 /DNA_START=64 /DNA_END=819 /DNA_ORIENTATION=-